MPLILKNKLSFAFESVSEKKIKNEVSQNQPRTINTQRFVRQTALTIELDNVVCLEAAETVQEKYCSSFLFFSVLVISYLQKFKHLCIWKMNAKDWIPVLRED